METVPEAPREKIVIPSQILERLQTWIEYFRALSPRVKIILPTDDNFQTFLSRIIVFIRQHKGLISEDVLFDFPEPERIAFTVAINSSKTAQPQYRQCDVRIFCYENIAFGPTYFEWDGDPEDSDHPLNYRYSLGNYSPEALSWHYVSSLIVKQIKELEETSVPLL